MEKSPPRFRFSLLTFLLAATIVGVTVSQWRTSRRLATANSELRQLRDLFGVLSVEDRSKVHAVAIEADEPDTWRWRLFLPKGARYEWNIAAEGIPQHAPPNTPAWGSASNEPYWQTENEVLVTARLREAEDGDWTLKVTSKIGDSEHQMSGISLKIPREKMAWRWTSPSTDGMVLGARGQQVLNPKGPIILLQQRGRVNQLNGDYDVPLPGFMIWLSSY